MSKRNYVTIQQVNDALGITVTDLQISNAEELIDNYVGPQNKFLEYTLDGLIAVGGANDVTLEQVHQNNMQVDFLKHCRIEIVGGTGEGQTRNITGQTYEGVITVDANFSPALDTTSFYKIYQLAKFPRKEDFAYDSTHSPQRYYKSIPEKIREAMLAQIEFMVNMGDEYFTTDKSDFQSENIGDYSYSKGNGGNGTGIGNMIAPKAKTLLRGIINRTGKIV